MLQQKGESTELEKRIDMSGHTLAFVFTSKRIYIYKRTSRVARPILNYDVLVSGGGVRVSDVTRGEGV